MIAANKSTNHSLKKNTHSLSHTHTHSLSLPFPPSLPPSPFLSLTLSLYPFLPPSPLSLFHSPYLPPLPPSLSIFQDFTSSSSSDEDGAERPGHRKRRPRTPVIIPQQKSHNRFSTASDQSGIVTSPTEQRCMYVCIYTRRMHALLARCTVLYECERQEA